MGAGDTIQLAAASYTGAANAAAGLVSTSVHSASVATIVAASNTVMLVRGTYDSTAQTFVGAAGGLDSLLAFDTDAALGTVAYEAVVLVGYNGGTASAMGGATGLITLGTAA